MQRLVGIIRTADELRESLEEIARLKERATRMEVEGHRQYNPGWHLALDLANMLVVSECIARAALEREESRGGHTRDDFPQPDPTWGALNLVLTLPGGDFTEPVHLERQPLPEHARRPQDAVRGELMGYNLKMRVWRGDGKRRRAGRLPGRRRGGRGRPRRDPPVAGHPGRRPRGALELQGGQVRLVQRRGQRAAAADVHDPAGRLRPGPRRSRSPRCGASR